MKKVLFIFKILGFCLTIFSCFSSSDSGSSTTSTTNDDDTTTTTGTKLWVQEAYIKASNNNAADRFSRESFSLDGDTLAVGAYQEDSNQTTITNDNSTASSNNSNTDSGAAYVYKRTGTTWAQEEYIKDSNNNAGDYFGY